MASRTWLGGTRPIRRSDIPAVPSGRSAFMPREGITVALGCGARSAESALIYELRLSRRRRLRG